MALGITLVELPCTAGFPMVWSRLVADYNLSTANFVLLLSFYLLVYLVEELIVFFTVLATLKASRLAERQGRVLKLIGGMIMLALALVLLIDPELMNSLSGSLLIFGSALLASLLILFVHSRLVPALNPREKAK